MATQDRTKTLSVPRVPKNQIVIELKNANRVEEWITYIREMSPRIRVERIIGTKTEFEEKLKAWFWELHQRGGIGVEKRHLAEVRDWPEPENIAFAIGIDMSPLADGKPKPEDTFVFCYYNFALGLDFYFRSDHEGDLRSGYWWAFLLPERPKGVTTWRGVLREIKRRLELAEKVVPSVE